jgi:hypothetical protein
MRSGRKRLLAVAASAVVIAIFTCRPASATDTITVSIAPDDSEIITSDLKRVRPAEGAEVRFKVVTPYIAQVFGNDLTVPRSRIRITVIGAARRVLGAMTGAQATGPDGPSAVVREIDRALSDMGVQVEQFNLRYVFVPGYTP